MKRLLLLLILTLSSCMPCRPMYVGMEWTEWERVHKAIEAGNYLKDCVYTKVTPEGEYEFDCYFHEVY